MSATRTKRSKRTSGGNKNEVKADRPIRNHRGELVDRPFDSKILRDAKQRAEQYQITLFRAEDEPDLWFGKVAEMPQVMNHGRTPATALKAAREMLTTVLAYHLEEDNPVPLPDRLARDEQVEVKLSADEVRHLQRAAQRDGFRDIAAFLRNAGLFRAG